MQRWTLDEIDGAIMRFSRPILGMRRPGTEDCVTWHTRNWRAARDQARLSWGGISAIYLARQLHGGSLDLLALRCRSFRHVCPRRRAARTVDASVKRTTEHVGRLRGCVSPAPCGGKSPTAATAPARLIESARGLPPCALPPPLRPPPSPSPRSPASSSPLPPAPPSPLHSSVSARALPPPPPLSFPSPSLLATDRRGFASARNLHFHVACLRPSLGRFRHTGRARAVS